MNVLHNGVITLNYVALWGPTQYKGFPAYKPYTGVAIRLQDHGNTVGYRYIWIRERSAILGH